MPIITKEEFLQFSELCNDAVNCARLTKWETNFIAHIGEDLQQFGEMTSLTDKQVAVIERIERKVYAT